MNNNIIDEELGRGEPETWAWTEAGVTYTAYGHIHGVNQPKCELCGKDWHGLTGDGCANGAYGCPGPYAPEDEQRAWLERQQVTPLTAPYTISDLVKMRAWHDD